MNKTLILAASIASIGLGTSVAAADTPPAPVGPAAMTAAPSPAPAPLESADLHEAVRRFSLNPPASNIKVRPVVEFGLLALLSHNYQGGRDGTSFDLRREGGQASAFFAWRLSAEAELFKRHTLIVLYQPLDLRTRATLTRDLRVNGLTFPTETPMQFRYGFDFYRMSYLYDLIASPRHELSLGLSLQLRVANIEFASLDGALQRATQNLGPVPLLKVRGRTTFRNDVFMGVEVDGIGIQFPSEQGSVLGVFFDASLRLGYSPTKLLETFVNLRYLGGGARGPGSKPLSPEFGDGYVDNFIHAMTVSVGLALQ